MPLSHNFSAVSKTCTKDGETRRTASKPPSVNRDFVVMNSSNLESARSSNWFQQFVSLPSPSFYMSQLKRKPRAVDFHAVTLLQNTLKLCAALRIVEPRLFAGF
jgi:hypothetical protein